MKCYRCGSDIDSATIDACQGDDIVCPNCGLRTRVQYTVRDEIEDPIGAFVFRDLKYARKGFRVVAKVALAVLLPFIAAGSIIMLIVGLGRLDIGVMFVGMVMALACAKCVQDIRRR